MSEMIRGYSRILLSLDFAACCSPRARFGQFELLSAMIRIFLTVREHPAVAAMVRGALRIFAAQPAVATIRARRNEGVDDAHPGWSAAAAAVRVRGGFQAQYAGVLRAARHQRDVRPGLLPRRP